MPTNNTVPDITWPTDMSEELRQEMLPLLSSYDNAIKALAHDHTVVFPTDSERNRLFFGFLHKWVKAWSKKGPCMYDGCTKASIPNSHSISLGASIRVIAENNHVLTPAVRDGVVVLESVGVREASTFPGFCEEHELLFAPFEAQKQLTDKDHFKLQAFRGVCREIYSQQHQKVKAEEMLAEYRRLRVDYILKHVQPAVPGGKVLSAQNLQFTDDPIESVLTERLGFQPQVLSELRDLYRGLYESITQASSTVDLTMSFVALDGLQLPVCLSGFGKVNYIDHGVQKDALCLVMIVPEQGKTHVGWLAKTEHAKAIEPLFGNKAPPVFLARLESCMVNGTDHWFITPSAWARIPAHRQKMICDQILKTYDLANEPKFSIFDDARRQYVQSVKDAIGAGRVSQDDLAAVRAIVAHEEAKLA